MAKRTTKSAREFPQLELDRNADLLEIAVPAEMANELAELASFYVWEKAEGLRIILGAGMGALQAQRQVQEDGDSDPEVKLRHLTRQLVRSEGRLAASRYRLFEAEQELRRLELSNAGLRELGIGLERANRRQLDEIEKLRLILKEKQSGIEGLQSRQSLEVQEREHTTS